MRPLVRSVRSERGLMPNTFAASVSEYIGSIAGSMSAGRIILGGVLVRLNAQVIRNFLKHPRLHTGFSAKPRPAYWRPV